MRKLVKTLHLFAAAGFAGATCVAWLAAFASPASLEAAATLHHLLALCIRWVALPSLVLLALTGLWSMVLRQAFFEAGWVWAKAAAGITGAGLVILAALPALARIAEVTDEANEAALGELVPLLAAARTALAVDLALAGLAIALGVWRPRFVRRAH